MRTPDGLASGRGVDALDAFLKKGPGASRIDVDESQCEGIEAHDNRRVHSGLSCQCKRLFSLGADFPNVSPT